MEQSEITFTKVKCACVACRKSRVKCDKLLPCARCRRLGIDCQPQLRGRGRPKAQHGDQPKRVSSDEQEEEEEETKPVVPQKRKLEQAIPPLRGDPVSSSGTGILGRHKLLDPVSTPNAAAVIPTQILQNRFPFGPTLATTTSGTITTNQPSIPKMVLPSTLQHAFSTSSSCSTTSIPGEGDSRKVIKPEVQEPFRGLSPNRGTLIYRVMLEKFVEMCQKSLIHDISAKSFCRLWGFLLKRQPNSRYLREMVELLSNALNIDASNFHQDQLDPKQIVEHAEQRFQLRKAWDTVDACYLEHSLINGLSSFYCNSLWKSLLTDANELQKGAFPESFQSVFPDEDLAAFFSGLAEMGFFQSQGGIVSRKLLHVNIASLPGQSLLSLVDWHLFVSRDGSVAQLSIRVIPLPESANFAGSKFPSTYFLSPTSASSSGTAATASSSSSSSSSTTTTTTSSSLSTTEPTPRKNRIGDILANFHDANVMAAASMLDFSKSSTTSSGNFALGSSSSSSASIPSNLQDYQQQQQMQQQQPSSRATNDGSSTKSWMGPHQYHL